jgi:hypothetical protein
MKPGHNKIGEREMTYRAFFLATAVLVAASSLFAPVWAGPVKMKAAKAGISGED